MQDGRSTVAPGRVGTGAAQVFDTTAPVNAYLNNLERRRLEGVRAAQKEAQDRKARKKAQEFDTGPNWSKFDEEIGGMTDAILKADRDAFAAGVDVTDPTTQAGRKRQQSIKAVQNKAAESVIARKIYDKARSEFDPNVHDVNHFNRKIDEYDAAESMGDLRKLETNFLVDAFDPYKDLSNIEVGNVLSVYENEKGVTTTYKNREDDPRFKKSMDNVVDNFLGSDKGQMHYERGVETGMWDDLDGQEAWVRENVIGSLPKEVKTTRKKQAKSGGGLNFNFGNGSGGSDDFNLQYEMKQSVIGGGDSDHEVVDIRGKKGKNFGAIQFNREDGEKIKLIPMEFERINGNLFVVGKQVPEGRKGTNDDRDTDIAQYETVRVRVDDNKSTIMNHFDGLDVDDFMNQSRDGMAGVKSEADSKVDEASLEDAKKDAPDVSSSGKATKEYTAEALDVLGGLYKDDGVKVSSSSGGGKSSVITIENDKGVKKELDLNNEDSRELYEKVKSGKVDYKLLWFKL